MHHVSRSRIGGSRPRSRCNETARMRAPQAYKALRDESSHVGRGVRPRGVVKEADGVTGQHAN